MAFTWTGFLNTLSRLWDRSTPADGNLFQTEFVQLMANDVLAKGNIDQLNTDLSLTASTGVVSGCAITNNNNGTVSIASGIGTVRATGSESDLLTTINLPSAASFALSTGLNYIYYDYNGGSPQWVATSNLYDFNGLDKVICFRIAKSGTTLAILDVRNQQIDGNRKLRRFLYESAPMSNVVGKSILGSPALLTISLTAGRFYFGLNPVDHNAFDTNVAGTANANVFSYYYLSGVGAWTEVENQKSINNTQYNASNALQTMGANKWKVDWVYLILDKDICKLAVVYGTAEYISQTSAEAASEPSSLPPLIFGNGVLVGRVILQKSSATITEVNSAFTTKFTPSTATTHEGMPDLQGGTTGEHNHLTNAEYTEVQTGKQTVHTGVGTTQKLWVRRYVIPNGVSTVAVSGLIGFVGLSGGAGGSGIGTDKFLPTIVWTPTYLIALIGNGTTVVNSNGSAWFEYYSTVAP